MILGIRSLRHRPTPLKAGSDILLRNSNEGTEKNRPDGFEANNNPTSLQLFGLSCS
jgi:hypothetical protein